MAWSKKTHQVLPSTSGIVPTKDAPLEGSYPPVEEHSSSGMSVTEDTTAVWNTTLPPSPPSSMPVPSTISHSLGNMVLTESQIGSAPHESDRSIVCKELLPALEWQKLVALSFGRSEDVNTTIDEIMKFFEEEESEYAEQPVDEAIRFYLDNFVY